jgi:hypothetical protein
MKLDIKRNNEIVVSVEIDEATIFTNELLGADKITSDFYLEPYFDFQIGDYVEYLGRKYRINSAVDCEMVDKRTFHYRMEFVGAIYDLYDEMTIHLGRTKFSYSGTPEDLLNLLVDSLNVDSPLISWTFGDCEAITDIKTFNFSEQSVRNSLTEIADSFGLEYEIKGKSICLKKRIGFEHDITLEYGRGKGLQGVVRQPTDKSFATVWYGFGGNQNLPENYRNGQDRLALGQVVERNVAIYGRKKGSVTFDGIYPQRTGVVSQIVNANSFVDNSLDFDINAQVVNQTAKVIFKSGELSGQEFTISAYSHPAKRITFTNNTDEFGKVFPNATFAMALGDKYTFIGIVMPASYIQAAEADLLKATQEHVKANSFPPVSFPLQIDEKYIREMDLIHKFWGGDSVIVKCLELGIWQKIRLQSVSYPLVNPAKISGVVSDTVPYSSAELMLRDLKKAKKDIAILNSGKAIPATSGGGGIIVIPPVVDNSKYLAISVNFPHEPDTISVIQQAKAAGCNAMQMTIDYRAIHGFNPIANIWSIYDAVYNEGKKMGKIGIRIAVDDACLQSQLPAGSENNNTICNNIQNANRMKGKGLNGDVLVYQKYAGPSPTNAGDGESRVLESLNSSVFKTKLTSFVTEVVNHFNQAGFIENLAWVSVVTTSTQELCYPFGTDKDNGGDYLFDYSDVMIAGFRTWLANKYQNLTAFNLAWSSNYATFSDVQPPSPNGATFISAFQGNAGKDWFNYRTKVLSDVNQQFYTIVKSINPNIKTITEFGSVYDRLSAQRSGNIDFKTIVGRTEGVKINNAPEYHSGFGMDLIRTAFPDKLICDEIEFSPSKEQMCIRQFNNSAKSGCRWMSLFQFKSFIDNNKLSIVTNFANSFLNSGGIDVDNTKTATFHLSDLLNKGGVNFDDNGTYTDLNDTDAFRNWKALYTDKPINLVMINDLT